jgi:hypothetical protein
LLACLFGQVNVETECAFRFLHDWARVDQRRSIPVDSLNHPSLDRVDMFDVVEAIESQLV